MNDDTDKPLNPVGDDALEARITAWVLGEASPFEAAELEEICARNPEARLFERRLRVLHAFITEDRKAGPEDEWKLPAEKRVKIEELFEKPVTVAKVVHELPKVAKFRQTGRRALLALAACTVISVATWSLLNTIGSDAPRGMAMRGRTAPAREKVEFLPGGAGGSGWGGGAALEAPATPASPPPPSVAEPAMPSTSFAAVERKTQEGKVTDESLAQLSSKAATRGSKVSGPPAKRSPSGPGQLAKNSRTTTKSVEVADTPVAGKPAATSASAAATGTVAGELALKGMAEGNKGRVRREVPVMPGSLGFTGGGAGGSAEPKTNFDSIPPAEVMAMPGSRPAGGPKAEIVTGGLRNGDGAITSHSIDAALGNPDRPAEAPGDAGLLSDNEVAQIQEGERGREKAGAANAPSDGVVWSDPNAPEEAARSTSATFKDLEGMGRLAESVGETSRYRFSGYAGTQLDSQGSPDVTSGIDSLADLRRKETALGSKDRDGATTGGLERDLTLEVNGSVTGAWKTVDAESAEKKLEVHEGLNANASSAEGFKHWLSQDEAVKAPVDLAAAKDRSGGVYGDTGLAQKEMIRRQNAVTTSDKLREEAREALAKGENQQAVDKLKAAEELLPEAPMVADRRAEVQKQLADASVALGDQYRKDGKYDEARQLADDALAANKDNAEAKKLAEYLDDPIRTSQPLTAEHARQVDEVRRKLYIAEGNYNLGKFDDAHRTYEDVLRIDPYNKAARRGMESVALAKQDYYRAAYDQTKSELLAEVDKAWELPAASAASEQLKELRDLMDVKAGADALPAKAPQAEGKPSVVHEAAVENSHRLLLEAREEYSEGDYAEAYRKYVESLQTLPNDSSVKDRRDFVQLSLRDVSEALASMALKLGDKELSNKWMEKGRNWVPKPEPKEQKVVDQVAETLTSAEPFSTFSLHVSDASFKLAKAALDRGEVPAADSIRPEEFYNAFDYGDPAPANGEPVTCAVEQSAHPAIPQRNLLRIGVKTGSQGRGGSTPLNLTLLLDSSGSMEREDRNAGLANAVKQLAGLLKEGDTVSVIGFARQPRLLADRLPGNRAQELSALLAQTPSEGGTNLEEGLKLGEELALRQFNPAAQNRIVLFTDGAANLGDAKPETLQAKVEAMRQKGLAFDAAGFGTDGLNDKLLERLTRNGNGRYYIVDRAEDADANFAKQLAGAFRPAAENVKVQVRFNPARVAKYKLIGFEEHRLNKEDFRNDTVDAAEMAAEEAGNALYQIEALPQGEGEVGEVSVRFRDAASGQMVERTWTIPYEAQALAFDQASPSIQLAGMAAFAAEKLRSAPMADAVDFQQLAPVIAKVKARYANSKPVADLEAMIGKLK